MSGKRNKLLSSTVMQVVAAAGLATGGAILLADISFAGLRSERQLVNPAAVSKSAGADGAIKLAACNPCKAKKGCNPCAAKKGCNPCAAKKGCNPCAAKKACGACNPCKAKSACGACNPCNPCGGGAAAASSKCMVPRLVTAALCNPCAAKKGCNPCAAKKACNPCGAKKACNPCGVKKACNPCGAKKGCNPCGAKKGCNPCGAKKGCNPCAAKKGCNPCAAKKGCNPCGAKACGACNPCGGGAAAPKLTMAEANSVYDCLKAELTAGYGKSGDKNAAIFVGWSRYNNRPYVSDTHGGRFVNNYANAQAANYKKFEQAGRMAVGARMAKDSFLVRANGKVAPGPLFLMEKMAAGFSEASGNWRYSMIMPNGQVFGQTNGKNSAGMKFCYECHSAMAEEQDHLFFLPDEYRKN